MMAMAWSSSRRTVSIEETENEIYTIRGAKLKTKNGEAYLDASTRKLMTEAVLHHHKSHGSGYVNFFFEETDFSEAFENTIASATGRLARLLDTYKANVIADKALMGEGRWTTE